MMFGNFGFPFFGGIAMLVFWILIVVGAIYLIKSILSNKPTEGCRHDAPLDILKRRYARGEIDKKEYENRKRDLDY